MIDLVSIAHVGSTQGKLGALKIFPIDRYEQVLLDLKFVFFLINGSKVPFKIKKINAEHDPWLLYLEDVTKPEKASSFSNTDLFVESNLIDEAIAVVPQEGMEGYEILSSDNTGFGIVLAVEEHPQQVLLLVDGEKGEFRIPFHPDLVQELDPENRKIIFSYTDDVLALLANPG